MYGYEFSERAQRQLEQITKRNPRVGASLTRKMDWLAENAESIKHARLKGSPYFSLHSASYRIIYELLASEQRIIIRDIGQHDEAYKRVNRLK